MARHADETHLIMPVLKIREEANKPRSVINLQFCGVMFAFHPQPGLGTNIEFWLPQSEAAPEVSAVHREPEVARGRGTALLVDDEEIVRFSTADMLGDLGFHVIEAASAEKAYIIENGVGFDLVVTDHLMPGNTGTELARTVHARRPGLPLLIISGYAEMDGTALDLPRLTKPFRKDELASSLATLSSFWKPNN